MILCLNVLMINEFLSILLSDGLFSIIKLTTFLLSSLHR